MSLRIEVAELGFAALDVAEADALAVLVGPERPLQGLAGFVDWRLCGGVSRAIAGGYFVPESGEALLLPSGGRLRIPRILCFGVPGALAAEGEGRGLARRVLDALSRARCRSFATSLPPAPGLPLPRIWIEASLERPAERQVLFGEARPLRRELEAARQAMLADVEISAFEAPAAPRRPAPGLPGLGTVVP